MKEVIQGWVVPDKSNSMSYGKEGKYGAKMKVSTVVRFNIIKGKKRVFIDYSKCVSQFQN